MSFGGSPALWLVVFIPGERSQQKPNYRRPPVLRSQTKVPDMTIDRAGSLVKHAPWYDGYAEVGLGV